jgi:hypothetical protein
MSIQGIYSRMWLVAATTEENINHSQATTERTSGHTYPGASAGGGHTSAGKHLSVSPPRGSETSVGLGSDTLFGWFGQYIQWFVYTEVPLPEPYHITWFQAFAFCLLLYLIGLMLGEILRGGY